MKIFAKRFTVLFVLFGTAIFPAFAQSGVPMPDPVYISFLDQWLFQDTNWLDTWGDPPTGFTNIALVPDWSDGGLQVDSTNPASLCYPITYEGYADVMLTNGTLSAWVLPNWASTNLSGTGPGDIARLIHVAWTNEDSSLGEWSLFVDAAGCNLCFAAQTNGGTETNFLFTPIAWDGVTWHEVEIT